MIITRTSATSMQVIMVLMSSLNFKTESVRSVPKQRHQHRNVLLSRFPGRKGQRQWHFSQEANLAERL